LRSRHRNEILPLPAIALVVNVALMGVGRLASHFAYA
jgi:hypothetical protein